MIDLSPFSRCNINNSGKDEYASLTNEYDTQKIRPTVLVHSCCGPCSTAVVERILPDYDVALFFYNPNITEEDEYNKRLENQEKFVEKYCADGKVKGKLTLIKPRFEPDVFLEKVKGFENSPEGGDRCSICIKMRMEKTAEYASMYSYEKFTTTLSVSPHKNYNLILSVGNTLALRYGLSFLSDNYRKMAGYQRSIELSKAYDLYRQSYCGCIFSKNERLTREKK